MPQHSNVQLAPRLPLRDESDLVERLRSGDNEALGQIYQEYRRAVCSAAYRIVGCASAAEDITQDTFVALQRALSGFRGTCALRTFVISIAINLARHQLRSTTRRRLTLSHYGETKDVLSGASPEQIMVERQTGGAILRALATLSQEKQQTFLLREYHEHSALETAQMTSVPEATVRTRVHHAKRMLREALVNQGYETAA